MRGLGWSWGSGRYQWWAYVIPLLYTVPVYLVVWLSGLGGFFDVAFVEKMAKEYGLSASPLILALIGYVALTMTAGFIPKTRAHSARKSAGAGSWSRSWPR